MSPAGLPAVSLGVAFLAGLTFFFSPCVWPLYPAYLSYLAGSVRGPQRQAGAPSPRSTGKVGAVASTSGVAIRGLWPRALGFILGFSVVFVALGASASAVGQWLFIWQPMLRRGAGVLISLAGLLLVGLSLPWRHPGRLGSWLNAEWRPGLDRWAQLDRGQWMTAVLLGAAFSIGWTPCLGPALTAILAYAATTATLGQGVLLLVVFVAGFALPFLALAALLPRLATGSLGRPGWRRWGEQVGIWGQRVTGLVLLMMGYLVGSGQLDRLAAWLTRWAGSVGL